MRTSILQRLNDTHQGISKCRERAAASVWWPGIGKAITAIVERCQTCRQKPTSTARTATVSCRVAQTTVAEYCDGYLPAQTKGLSGNHRLLFTMDRNKTVDESNIGMCHQSCQSCFHYARRTRCRRIGQQLTIRVGRVQTLCRRDVFN